MKKFLIATIILCVGCSEKPAVQKKLTTKELEDQKIQSDSMVVFTEAFLKREKIRTELILLTADSISIPKKDQYNLVYDVLKESKNINNNDPILKNDLIKKLSTKYQLSEKQIIKILFDNFITNDLEIINGGTTQALE
ncbi:hypothetical protein [Soonwooa sp.]|uniref:hypothetical protein n=1 Tax=Soonwooa sp. TaxID=1938592 RepID=UPI0028A5F9F8|nr:hypothetical protein [Soonwooa sp.]